MAAETGWGTKHQGILLLTMYREIDREVYAGLEADVSVLAETLRRVSL
jgi:hypothetical protein